MIRRNVELEARLIDDLLDLTRIVRERSTSREPPRPPRGSGRVTQNARSEFFARGVKLSSELNANAHFCLGDGARLQQVFWNLLKNSAKFTPAGGSVVIRSENPAAGRIRVAVEDTGRGIRSDLLPRLFEAFEQGDVTAVRRGGGLGLGLAIARTLVQLHGGVITAESAGEGQGAVFAVSSRRRTRKPSRLARGPGSHDRAASRHRLSILIVEDDLDTADALGPPARGERVRRPHGRQHRRGERRVPPALRPTSSSPTWACPMAAASTCSAP